MTVPLIKAFNHAQHVVVKVEDTVASTGFVPVWSWWDDTDWIYDGDDDDTGRQIHLLAFELEQDGFIYHLSAQEPIELDPLGCVTLTQTGDAGSVPEDERITFKFSMFQPVTMKELREAMARDLIGAN